MRFNIRTDEDLGHEAPYYVESFNINGHPAEVSDFGNEREFPFHSTVNPKKVKDAMHKYEISAEEYINIAYKLEQLINYGRVLHLVAIQHGDYFVNNGYGIVISKCSFRGVVSNEQFDAAEVVYLNRVPHKVKFNSEGALVLEEEVLPE